jgi:hypothetical protein
LRILNIASHTRRGQRVAPKAIRSEIFFPCFCHDEPSPALVPRSSIADDQGTFIRRASLHAEPKESK